MPTPAVPSSPSPPSGPHDDWPQIRRQAKELLRAYRSGDRLAREKVDAFFDGADPHSFRLAQAQLVLARSQGFASWTRLKESVQANAGARMAGNRRRPRAHG